jgi:RNA polymerase-binding transcription factor DksA
MHYHYFTLEQRSALEQAIRSAVAMVGVRPALEHLHSPDYGVCRSCGADIPFVRLVADPLATRCRDCAAKL